MTVTADRRSRRRALLVIVAGMTFVAGAAVLAVGLLWQHSSQADLVEQTAAVAASLAEQEEVEDTLTDAEQQVRDARVQLREEKTELGEKRADALTTMRAADDMLELAIGKRDLDRKMVKLQEDAYQSFLQGDIDRSNALIAPFDLAVTLANEAMEQMWKVSEKVADVDDTLRMDT
jgi:nucleotide-binding universal stress UspA family protein